MLAIARLLAAGSAGISRSGAPWENATERADASSRRSLKSGGEIQQFLAIRNLPQIDLGERSSQGRLPTLPFLGRLHVEDHAARPELSDGFRIGFFRQIEIRLLRRPGRRFDRMPIGG